MAIITPSPICLVDGYATTNGVNVSTLSTVTISLQDSAGVKQWNIDCIYTDELNDAASINGLMTVDFPTKTATFTTPTTEGSTFIFQSKVNNGVDNNGVVQPSYTTTFGVFILSSTGNRVLAFNETSESNSEFGYIVDVNPILREGVAPDINAGAGLTKSGNTLNVGQNADNSITVNANDIQLKAAYQALLDGATNLANVGTLAKRNADGEIQLSGISGTATYGGNIVADKADTFSITQDTPTTNTATKDLFFTSQAPYASATLTNRLPGDIIFNIPEAAGALATTNSGAYNFRFAENTLVQLYEQMSDQTGVINFPNFGRIDECSSVNSSSTLTCNAGTNLNLYGTPIGLLSTGDITAEADNDIIITASNNIKLVSALGTIVNSDATGIDSTLTKLIVKNVTPATSGNQQATFLKFSGQGWKTTATAASQEVAHYIESLPVQGSSNPSGQLKFLYQINGGTVNTGFYHDSIDNNFGNSLHCSTMVSSSGGHRFNDANNYGGLDLNGSSELRIKSYNTKAISFETQADSSGVGGVEILRLAGDGAITLNARTTITYSNQGTPTRVDTFNPAGSSTIVWAAGTTSITDSWAQAASGIGGTRTISGQKGAAGSVGGKIVLTTGAGGTPGTNLGGAFDIDLGTAVSGASPIFSLKTNSTTVGTLRGTSAGWFYILSGDSVSGTYVDGGIMYIHSGAAFTLDANPGVFTFAKASATSLNLTVSSNGATIFAPVSGSTSMTFKQATAVGNGVASSASSTYSAQDAKSVASGINNSGGNLILSSGAVGTGGSGGTPGTVSIRTGATEVIGIDGTGNIGLFGAASAGGGVNVVFIHNATTVPTTDPTAGGILYVEAGALKYRGPSGTVTTIANA